MEAIVTRQIRGAELCLEIGAKVSGEVAALLVAADAAKPLGADGKPVALPASAPAPSNEGKTLKLKR